MRPRRFLPPLVLTGLSLALLATAPRLARADVEDQTEPPLPPPPEPDAPPKPPADPTGGAYTSPTLLFIPAASVPKWDVRAIVSVEAQRPADIDAKVRPGAGIELGLPGRITVGAGTNWVGGDVNPNNNTTDVNLALRRRWGKRERPVETRARRGGRSWDSYVIPSCGRRDGRAG